MPCFRLRLWLGYFIFFKLTRVSSIVYQSLHFSSIKETNWLVSKGMCVLLFDVFNGSSVVKKYIGKGMSNIYYWEKLTFSKLVGKVNFSERKLKKCTSFAEQKGTRYIRGNTYFGIIVFSCLLSTKSCLRFLLFCFAREIKRLYQRHNKRFPKC